MPSSKNIGILSQGKNNKKVVRRIEIHMMFLRIEKKGI
jgi:hypothetical protein